MAPATLTEAILAQPLLALLRRRNPLGRLDALTTGPMQALFAAMPEVDEVIASGLRPESIGLTRRIAIARDLAARRYDEAYVLPDVLTAGFAPWLAGIPNRISPSAREARAAADRPRGAGRARSTAMRYAALAFEAGEPLPPGIPAPQLGRPPVLDDRTARQLGLADDGLLILFCPGSELGDTSQWPARHYANLALQIHATWPLATIGMIGRKRDRQAASHIAMLSGGRIRNWVGELELAPTMGLMQRADAVVSGESQYMHLAAALRRPHVALYGAGDPRAERIADARRKVLWLHLACSPCLDAHCRFGHTDCMNGIAPAAAMSALRQTIEFAHAT